MKTLAIASLFLFSACGSEPSDTQCEKVVDHVLSLYAKSKSEVPEANLSKVKSVVGKDMLKTCKEDMSTDAIACYMKKRSVEGLASCHEEPTP